MHRYIIRTIFLLLLLFFFFFDSNTWKNSPLFLTRLGEKFEDKFLNWCSGSGPWSAVNRSEQATYIRRTLTYRFPHEYALPLVTVRALRRVHDEPSVSRALLRERDGVKKEEYGRGRIGRRVIATGDELKRRSEKTWSQVFETINLSLA